MSRSLRFRVGEDAAGRRLDEFLASRLETLSRMRIADLLARGACKVNETAAAAGRRVREGDLVEFSAGGGAPTSMAPEPVPLEVVYEDAHLVVVVKPAGMLVHPTRGVKNGTLANALAHHLNKSRGAGEAVVRPGLAHRLDRATSGLLVVAKQQRALSILSRHFHHRLVEKRYLALVRGRPAAGERLIRAPVGRDPEEHPQWRVLEGGRPAETRLHVLERRETLALVELEPITGRTNQLRIHCAHIGHPIVGDEWYDGAPSAARLCLHASRLAFHHPDGGRRMEFTSPLPDEIKEILGPVQVRASTCSIAEDERKS